MTKPKTSPHTYVGNPGYLYDLDCGVIVAEPGVVVDLTDADVAKVGGDFVPAKPAPKTPAADAADTPKDPA